MFVNPSIRPDIRYPAFGLAGYPAKSVSGASLAYSHPYSLSAQQHILIPIPSLLYSIFSSLFPLYSTAYSHPYSLSA
jgi:hypothetical protein